VEVSISNGFSISNIDCTIICEQPKIGPHANAMRKTLADITNVDIDRISVKATTSEKLGFTGRGEGIAAQATTTLVKI
jgi:2-C-methyl-D-erythritol 2,4-cyclodiphosphate synthase